MDKQDSTFVDAARNVIESLMLEQISGLRESLESWSRPFPLATDDLASLHDRWIKQAERELEEFRITKIAPPIDIQTMVNRMKDRTKQALEVIKTYYPNEDTDKVYRVASVGIDAFHPQYLQEIANARAVYEAARKKAQSQNP